MGKFIGNFNTLNTYVVEIRLTNDGGITDVRRYLDRT